MDILPIEKNNHTASFLEMG